MGFVLRLPALSVVCNYRFHYDDFLWNARCNLANSFASVVEDVRRSKNILRRAGEDPAATERREIICTLMEQKLSEVCNFACVILKF